MARHGVRLSEAEVLARFRDAYNTPWGGSTIRYVGDGRPFWRHIVALSTGSEDQALFEDIYEYYARGEAWTVSPGAIEALRRLRGAGMRTAIVSNFDSRLRRILEELGVSGVFDAVAISAEVGGARVWCGWAMEWAMEWEGDGLTRLAQPPAAAAAGAPDLPQEKQGQASVAQPFNPAPLSSPRSAPRSPTP